MFTLPSISRCDSRSFVRRPETCGPPASQFEADAHAIVAAGPGKRARKIVCCSKFIVIRKLPQSGRAVAEMCRLKKHHVGLNFFFIISL